MLRSRTNASKPKVLLFGGSFDPPHLGHVQLLKSAITKLHPERAYLIPAYHSPLKAPSRASAADRLQMTRRLLRAPGSRPNNVRVDSFELNRRRKTFTYQVLRHFHRRHPGSELWFLIGDDSLAQFSKWKRSEELRRSCRWIAGARFVTPAQAPREQLSGRLRALGNKSPRTAVLADVCECGNDASIFFPECVRLPGRFPPWSSTEIRNRILAGLDVAKMLPPAVYAHIRRRRLYGLDIHRELKRTLAPERYAHTLGVAHLALTLAARYRLDPEAAATAGLLHDCGRKFDLTGMVRYARRRRLRAPHGEKIIRHAPILLHAFISADLAERRFGVHDPKILSAISNHTLGEAGMPPLDRLLYVADIASEDRGFPEAKEIRKMAEKNINRAALKALRTKIRYVRSKDQWLHPGTGKFLTWLKTL